MDHVYNAFLERQYEEAMALAEESDLLEVLPGGGRPPDKYIVRFSCKGLVHTGSEVVEAENFAVGIWMPSDYLRRVDPFHAVSWLSPENIHHPNVGRGPFRNAGPLAICLGQMAPGVSLVDLIYQVFEIITYNKATMREDDALNFEACRYARWNMHRFPVDTRPLKRRMADFEIEEIGEYVGEES